MGAWTVSRFSEHISCPNINHSGENQKVYFVFLANKSGFPRSAEDILKKAMELGK